MSFTNLTGTALLEGNDISGGRVENLRVTNSTGSLDLTIQDSASDQAVFGHNNLNGNDFGPVGDQRQRVADPAGRRRRLHRCPRRPVADVASGTSSHDLTITDSNFNNSHANSVGGGVTIGGGGGGSDITVDYRVIDSNFTGAVSTALNATFTNQAGDIRGHISGNVVGINDGLSTAVGSSTGNGISVGLDKIAGAGDATYTATIENNQVYDVDFGTGGITVIANGGGAGNPAIMEVVVDGNTVAEMGDFALAAFYSLIGGSAFTGDFAELGPDADRQCVRRQRRRFRRQRRHLRPDFPGRPLLLPGLYGGFGRRVPRRHRQCRPRRLPRRRRQRHDQWRFRFLPRRGRCRPRHRRHRRSVRLPDLAVSGTSNPPDFLPVRRARGEDGKPGARTGSFLERPGNSPYISVMALLPIFETPDPVLRQISSPVEKVDDALRVLIDDMFDTMYAAPGIGLAAIQVGVPRRLLVIDLQEPEEEDGEPVRDPLVFINPEILETSETTRPYQEGCLSVPDQYAEVMRPDRVRARWLDRDGKQREEWIDGLLAVCLQHEIDHLNGILFIDHLSRLKRDMIMKKLVKARREMGGKKAA